MGCGTDIEVVDFLINSAHRQMHLDSSIKNVLLSSKVMIPDSRQGIQVGKFYINVIILLLKDILLF